MLRLGLSLGEHPVLMVPPGLCVLVWGTFLSECDIAQEKGFFFKRKCRARQESHVHPSVSLVQRARGSGAENGPWGSRRPHLLPGSPEAAGPGLRGLGYPAGLMGARGLIPRAPPTLPCPSPLQTRRGVLAGRRAWSLWGAPQDPCPVLRPCPARRGWGLVRTEKGLAGEGSSVL